MHLRRGLAIAAVASVLVAAGCGSSDDDDATTTTAAGDSATTGTSGGSSAGAPTGDPIVIGLGNTEATVIQAQGARQVLDAAIKYINEEQGGVNGRPLELEACASEGTPESSSQCANQLVAAHPVAIVLQGVTDETPYVNAASAAGIPIFVSQGSGATLTSDTSFSLNAGIIGLHAAVAQYAVDQDDSKVALVVTDVPAARGAAESAVPNYEAAGLDVSEQYAPAATADMTPAITAAISSGAQLVFSTTDPATCISSLKAADLLQYDGQMVLSETCYADSVIEGAGDAIDDTIVTKANIDVGGEDAADDEDVTLYKHIVDTYTPDTPLGDPAAVNAMAAFMTMYRSILSEMDPATIDSASVLEAAHHLVDAPIFLRPGAEATCDGEQAPDLVAVCSTTYLLYRVTNDKKLEFVDSVDAGAVLRQED